MPLHRKHWIAEHWIVKRSVEQMDEPHRRSGITLGELAEKPRPNARQLTLRGAITRAQQNGHLDRLSIHRNALGVVNLLEAGDDASAVVGHLSRALFTLQAYAQDGSPDRGNPQQWCHKGGRGADVSANMVAMTESLSVRRTPAFFDARSFAVDPRLVSAGCTVMLAHIKLGNGQHAPRLHFLDDTRGGTGRVHIGYIGPHLPTARDP